MHASSILHDALGFEVLPRGIQIAIGGKEIPRPQFALRSQDETTAPEKVIPPLAAQAPQGFVYGCPGLRNPMEVQSASGLLLQRHGQAQRHIYSTSRLGPQACFLQGCGVLAHQLVQPGQIRECPGRGRFPFINSPV
jgi:hypothetical protein